MPRMIPEICDPTCHPESERRVFAALQQGLSAEWTVFHSLQFMELDQQKKQQDAEIDFLIYHPVKGILVLEVKGGIISHENGRWMQNGSPMKDPFRQVEAHKHAIRGLLQDSLRRSIPLKFAHGVCFPDCRQGRIWPPAARGCVWLAGDLAHVERAAEDLLERTFMPPGLKGEIAEADVMKVLNPFLRYGGRLYERIETEERQFLRFTEEQYKVLDSFNEYRRLQVKGCAGSGKTLLAVRKARQLAEQGHNVLLLCYNQLLAGYLQSRVADEPGVHAVAFFDFCENTLGLPPKGYAATGMAAAEYYDSWLPAKMVEYLQKTGKKVDAVIVDEGQDFPKTVWNALMQLVKPDGWFYIFWDPEQNIFRQDLQLPDFGFPPAVLSENCRNTQKICEAFATLLPSPVKSRADAPEGVPIREMTGALLVTLKEALEHLHEKEKVSMADVVILGARRLENTPLGRQPKLGYFTIVDGPGNGGRFDVSYYTYLKYKGCEAKVVILFDVDRGQTVWRDAALYVAMSRAVHQLIILRRNKAAG